MNFKNRLRGCLIYGAVGDALGSRYEGVDVVAEVSENFYWTVSDDTQLTLATCEAIHDRTKVEPERIANHFLMWFNQRRLTGLGSSTLKALRELQVGGHWALVGNSGERAAGNGGAMRIAPLAFKSTVDRTTIRDVCSITHKNDEAYVGALAIYWAISLACSGSWKGGLDLIEKIIVKLPDTNVRDRLLEFSGFQDASIEDIVKLYKPSGYVVDSVPTAIFAAQQIGKLPIQTIFKKLIHAGGDTDTVCSMAGQIIGAFLGDENIPTEWLVKLEEDLKSISELIEAMVKNWRE